MPLKPVFVILWCVYAAGLAAIVHGWAQENWSLGFSGWLTMLIMIFNAAVIAFANWKLYRKYRKRGSEAPNPRLP